MKAIGIGFLAFVVGAGLGASVEMHIDRQLLMQAQENADQAAGLEDECEALLSEQRQPVTAPQCFSTETGVLSSGSCAPGTTK